MPKYIAANNVNTYACKKATNNSKVIINKTNSPENIDTPYPAKGCISPNINIMLKKDNIIICPAVILANNLIINTRGFKKTPKISIGVSISNTGFGTPGIAKICFQ